MPGLGPHCLGMSHSSHSFKPVGGTEEMQPNPHQWQLQQPTVGPQHSHLKPRPRLASMRAAQRMGQQEAAPVPFLKPDPVAHLVGCPNEAPVIVDGQRMTTFIDSDAQVSSISSQFCKDLTLQIQCLGRLLELEGMGGSTIPYLRYVEINLQILGIKNYNEDVLLLVIPTTPILKRFQSWLDPKL